MRANSECVSGMGVLVGIHPPAPTAHLQRAFMYCTV